MFIPIAAKPNGTMCGERPVRTALFSDISADLELNLFYSESRIQQRQCGFQF